MFKGVGFREEIEVVERGLEKVVKSRLVSKRELKFKLRVLKKEKGKSKGRRK